MMNPSFAWGGRKMESSNHGNSRARIILLLAGFAMIAALGVTLVLYPQSPTGKQQAPTAVSLGSEYHRSDLPDLTAAHFSRPVAAAPKVSSLNELLPGLEAKVAANPQDVDLQILLAQTYAELGQPQKAQELMDKVHQKFPEDSRVPFARAKILMAGKAPTDLRRAIHLFEESALSDPNIGHLARLHQGQILLRLGDRERARQIWRDYIATLPVRDERRSLIEAELAHIPSS
jgi:cytochrome c-type biogenesis protein CcmH/NrfG